jgi:hypothetical protein
MGVGLFIKGEKEGAHWSSRFGEDRQRGNPKENFTFREKRARHELQFANKRCFGALVNSCTRKVVLTPIEGWPMFLEGCG